MNKLQITSIVVACLILGGCITDCSCGYSNNIKCKITRHEYHPAWTEVSISTDSDGNTSVDTTYHAEEFHLISTADEMFRAFDIEVSKDYYNYMQDGVSVSIRAREGKWTGIIYSAHFN